ncbi:MAG: ribbon-helix-helix protein, CopG family [Candidatus Bipolaricaulaceae bacterium]
MAAAEGRRRVQFVLPHQTVVKLDLLKARMGAASRTEVLRVALELLHWACEHIARGEEVAAASGDEVEETIAIPGAYLPPC